jgi:hypothetical protein
VPLTSPAKTEDRRQGVLLVKTNPEIPAYLVGVQVLPGKDGRSVCLTSCVTVSQWASNKN